MANISNMIKRAFITMFSKDEANYRADAQANYLDKIVPFDQLSPYGLDTNAPRGALVLMMNVQGQEENLIGIAYHPTIRFKNLKEGETVFWNPTVGKDPGTWIHLDAEGNMKISTNKDVVWDVEENMTITCKKKMKLFAEEIWLNGDDSTVKRCDGACSTTVKVK